MCFFKIGFFFFCIRLIKPMHLYFMEKLHKQCAGKSHRQKAGINDTKISFWHSMIANNYLSIQKCIFNDTITLRPCSGKSISR